jgi:GT2 family glycosyltransferase
VPVRASIIVLTKSTQADHTRKCLYWIEKNTSNYELFVVRDDPKEFGFSKNNNRMIRASLGKYIVLMNDDCFAVQQDWLDKMISRAEEDPSIGIVAPMLYGLDGKLQYSADKKMDSKGIIADIPFACVLIKHALIDQVGFMNESFRYSSEDYEYEKRAKEKGWKIAIASDVKLVHLFSTSRDTKASFQFIKDEYLWRRNIGKPIQLKRMLLLVTTVPPRKFVKTRAPAVADRLKKFRSHFHFLP